MEGVRSLHGALHRDVTGQAGVGATHPGVGIAVKVGIEMCHLHQRMHPGVGPSRTDRGDASRREFSQRGFQMVLNGLTRRLALPALVGLTVVADA